ncbi:MAG: PhoX family protein [Gammaproteobacteria bacterium]
MSIGRARLVSFHALLDRRVSRRQVLSTLGAIGAGSVIAPSLTAVARGPFAPVKPQNTDAIVLPRGYTWDRIARWGDALFADTPSLTARNLLRDALLHPGAAARQARQFGSQCDAVAFFAAAGRTDRGVLCVNNEYVQAELAFRTRPQRGLEPGEGRRKWIEQYPQVVAVMMAAHGVSILEVAQRRGRWRRDVGAPLTRRITGSTPCEITGPARGAALLRTKADPAGTLVLGTIANCAGGKTPWGTYLTAEENVDDYFGYARTWAGARSADDAETVDAYRRFPLRERSLYGWEHAESRFDVRSEPREALRFGWIVEIDPRDPQAPPRKRTALGRFSHEGANTAVARDGRVAAYMGDDDMFEYVYKFVTRRAFDPEDPRANRELLDDGTLYVARFDADGTGEWLPLVYEERGPLNRRSGFASQADVVIKARAAADLLGATPMDRPEDIEPSPLSGRVYLSCTRNLQRREAAVRAQYMGREIDLGVNAANPRAANTAGHIIELIEDGDDAAATSFRWEIFLFAGESVTPDASPLACPDNLGFDPSGRLWIVTDSDDPRLPNSGCFVCQTSGPERGVPKQILSAPVGAEVCGCEFTPDGRTLFLSIQHPGQGGTVEAPRSHWPDGGDLPPRPTLIAVRREDGDPL